MPAAEPQKTQIILRLLEGDAERHAIRLQLARGKLSTKVGDLVERFARHHNRRCAPGATVDAASLAAADAEGPLERGVAVGNLLDPTKGEGQTLTIELRRASAALDDDAAPSDDDDDDAAPA
mmetsp:Transcript_32085/g.96376  ORF Transcript_32085/g.96376 Transcript_32085/m.96376 type:complete len:122 (-) Transcript_32085:279-644(-)